MLCGSINKYYGNLFNRLMLFEKWKEFFIVFKLKKRKLIEVNIVDFCKIFSLERYFF